jgi:prepilin signal peptidase PulO-like enzyme (type II secretory pathway)
MRKMDEMELKINQKGIKWSWFFMVLSLFTWGGYNYIKTQEISFPLILVILQFLVYYIVTSISKLKIDDDSSKKQILISIGVLFLLIAFGTILYFTVGR